MAELVNKIGDGAGYEDGDCLCAFNGRMISCTHAGMITAVRKAGFNRDGLRQLGTIFEDWYALTHQYKFTRVGRTTVERLDQIAATSRVFDSTPILVDGAWQHMDVPEFVNDCVRRAHHRIFGSYGKEVGYGGHIDTSLPVLNRVWNAIETKTPFRKADHTRWPAGRQDLRSHLFLPVTDFDDATAQSLVMPLLDAKGVRRKKRSRFIDWRSLSVGRPESEILDRGTSVDVRDIPNLDHTAIVQVKP